MGCDVADWLTACTGATDEQLFHWGYLGAEVRHRVRLATRRHAVLSNDVDVAVYRTSVRVLVVNKFLHHVGGVETYVEWQAANFDRAGISVHFFGMEPPPGREVIAAVRDRYDAVPNREFNGTNAAAAKAAFNSVYSSGAEHRLSACIDSFQPDVVHFHSTCRQLTPSVARAVTRKGVPSVLTAHEYKQVCATQRLWDERRNELCTACLTGGTLSRMMNIAKRRCVRGSTIASAFAIPEIPIADHLWAQSDTVIHAPSRFMSDVISQAPYIPNRVHTLDLPWGATEARLAKTGWERRAIYIGRLEREKGVDVLLDAWRTVENMDEAAELIVAGGGAERRALEQRASELGLERVRFTGRYERHALGDLLGQVAVSVHPSKWFENSPYAVRESLLFGVPAIVTDVGGMPEMVDARTGSVVPPGNTAALSEAIVAEFAQRRAGTSGLRAAVSKRAMSDDSHLYGLLEMYGTAAS